MTTEQLDELKEKEQELIKLRAEMDKLREKCDHKYPDGKDGWEVGWSGTCHEAQCLICGMINHG